MKKIKETKK